MKVAGPYSENPVERYHPGKCKETIKTASKRKDEKQTEGYIIKCPQRKTHLGGSLKGQIISFAGVPYGESRCPLSMGCKDPCAYKESI
jgi:hypothetical protein